jgi:hypothetical protein
MTSNKIEEILTKYKEAPNLRLAGAYLDAKKALNQHYLELVLEIVTDEAETCELDCSPERHAYHKGQWDMERRIEIVLNQRLGEDK